MDVLPPEIAWVLQAFERRHSDRLIDAPFDHTAVCGSDVDQVTVALDSRERSKSSLIVVSSLLGPLSIQPLKC